MRLYWLAVHVTCIGIVFLICAVLSQELARVFVGRPLSQKYSALPGLFGMLLLYGVEVVVTFLVFAITARFLAGACNGCKLSMESTLVAGLLGLFLVGSVTQVFLPLFSTG